MIRLLRNLKEIWPFFLFSTAAGVVIAIVAVDTIRLKECKTQINELRQELTYVQEELSVCREKK